MKRKAIIFGIRGTKLTNDEKNRLEEEAMIDILSNLPEKIQKDYYSIWKDYSNNISLESKFVHQLDKLEMILQAKIYEKDVGYEKIKQFLTSSVALITDDDLKRTLKEIIQ